MLYINCRLHQRFQNLDRLKAHEPETFIAYFKRIHRFIFVVVVVREAQHSFVAAQLQMIKPVLDTDQHNMSIIKT